MASDFNAGMEAAFEDFRKHDGNEEIMLPSGETIPVIAGDFMRRTEVGKAGLQEVVSGTITIKVQDWLAYGLKKGSRLTLPSGRAARIEAEPYIPADGAGTIDVTLIAE